MATIASKENHKYGNGKKIDGYTYITATGVEKGIPHAFFDEDDLYGILRGKYSVIKLERISGEIPDADKHMRKGTPLDHWLILVERK